MVGSRQTYYGYTSKATCMYNEQFTFHFYLGLLTGLHCTHDRLWRLKNIRNAVTIIRVIDSIRINNYTLQRCIHSMVVKFCPRTTATATEVTLNGSKQPFCFYGDIYIYTGSSVLGYDSEMFSHTCSYVVLSYFAYGYLQLSTAICYPSSTVWFACLYSIATVTVTSMSCCNPCGLMYHYNHCHFHLGIFSSVTIL